ncbi:DNAJC14 [Acanthosepion pharaonis]|uniref:DNAJC14 n=1 Tax=Acanthosepion pharaonis TaxID=158019 RepID=A0A812DHP9_ACAPH|nr:DNAJC14 [Sepia pharaonis]
MADTVNEDGFRFGMSATGRDTAAATTTRPRDEEYNPLNNWPLFGHLHTVHPNPVISPYSWHHVDCVPPGPAQPNLGYTYNPLSSAPEMYSYINHLSSNEELPPEEIQAILGQSLGVSVDALPQAKDCVADSSSFRCSKTAIGSERKSAEASRAQRLKIEREEFINAIPDKPYGPFMYSRLLESPSTFEEQSATMSSSSSSLRPTYSEVAKLSKEKKVVNSRTASPKDDIENFQKKMSPHDNLIKSPSHKPRRVNSNHKKQKNISASIMSHSVPVVSPDSKYGLDKFEQTDIKKEDCSQGVNNASLYGFSDGNIPVSMSGMSNKMKNQDRGSNHRHHSRFLFGIERATLDDYGKVVKSKLRWLIHQLWMMTVTSVVLVLAIVTGLVHLMILVGSKVWNVFVSRIWKKYSRAWKWKKGDDKTSRKIGLDENIKLPSTGEEAMQRLLSCRGKDPYSILGLRADSTDEDIKKYYKKQAILVHPDKNSQTGAEEAFKILRHAFEMIGEPEKRVKYDAQMQQSDQAMREFADLLNKLKERFKQEANMMKCDQCGGKHQRIPVDKPWYSARYCDKCNINHPAKEGDVWAQTSMLGFLWHYYACMDGHVYDITEWVSCRKGLFKHLKSNSHQVFYRIETDTDRGGSHRTGEADLDGFINQLLNQARQSDPSNSTSSTSSHNNNSIIACLFSSGLLSFFSSFASIVSLCFL